MRLSATAMVAACLTLIEPGGASAHEVKKKGLHIIHPWAHESVDKSTNSAGVYMTIRNFGRTSDRLLSATTTRAAEARLVPVSPEVFSIAPGKETTLKRANGYVHLNGLNKPLYVHDNFPLTLTFEKAGRIKIDVHIEEAGVSEPLKH